MRCLGHRKVLLPAEAEPLMRDHARARAAGDFYGIIATAAVDDERFGSEGGGGKAVRERRARIARDDNERQGERGEQIGHRVGRQGAATILALAPRKVPEGAAHSTSKPARKPPPVFALATRLPTRHHAPTMQRVLIIRSSSLGDIVHALPVVHDMRRHSPDVRIDWVAEEPFAALVRLNQGVRRVVPVALRRWRYRLLSRATWREVKAFRDELVRERYDAVIDLQEQVKGALIAWLAHGPVHGPDYASAHEAVAALFYRLGHRIDARQHLLLRCRLLAGKVLGYEPEGAPRFDLSPPAHNGAPDAPYVVCLHGTSQDEKLWPEAHWRAVLEQFAHTGTLVVLPWGNRAEADRSERLAAGLPGVTVPAWRALPELAALLAGAQLVIGVDTGPTHLAAALGRPTVALFTATDPLLNGVEPASALARDVGGPGTVPEPAQAIAAAGALLRASPAC